MNNPEKQKNVMKLEVHKLPNESEATALGKTVFGPALLPAMIAFDWTHKDWNPGVEPEGVFAAMVDGGKKINAGDLSEVEAALANQAMALTSIFANLSHRAKYNVSQNLEAFSCYMKLALKAQNQARMTLETLANVKNPPVVYAKQANIANGPQQVNNMLHAHAREKENMPIKVLEQSHEQRMDTGSQSETVEGNSQMETVGALNGSENN